ncbi:response regulator [Tenacibaculum sp. C7A-26P2]|uniref:response regulator n=1 Tax=Tenacibaculum sp. C7A-26P2 TaxID=3447504 RepID=UPI003F85E616
MSEIKVAIVEEKQRLVESYISLFKFEDSIKIEKIFTSHDEFIEWKKQHKVDVVIVTFSIPHFHSIDLLEKLKYNNLIENVLVLSEYQPVECAKIARFLDCKGYALKSEPEAIIKAVKSIYAGNNFFINYN